MRIRAIQNPGTENKIKTRTVIDLSARLPCRTAEITPRGMAIKKMITIEAILIYRVIGSLSFIFSHTGLSSDEMDLPKSSFIRFFIHT